MGASGGKSSSASKPIFLAGQKDFATQILTQVLAPLALGGAPDAGTEIAANRSRQGLTQSLAQQGLTGSGLAAKSASNLEAGLADNAARQRFDVINRIFSPLGQSSSSSGFQLGIDAGISPIKVK